MGTRPWQDLVTAGTGTGGRKELTAMGTCAWRYLRTAGTGTGGRKEQSENRNWTREGHLLGHEEVQPREGHLLGHEEVLSREGHLLGHGRSAVSGSALTRA